MTRDARGKLIAIGATAGILFFVGLDLRETPKPEVKQPAARAAPGQRCKGYHGEARNFAGLVKKSLRNPGSFEHVETTYGPVDDGAMVATMTYRATNAYGAVDTYLAIGEVQADDCKARVLKAE